MSYVRITLSREMLQILLANLAEIKSPACEYVVEGEINGVNEITRIINIVSGDVFEQVVQKQEEDNQLKNECKIYDFPSRNVEGKDFTE